MVDSRFPPEWVDRYVRGELPDADEEAFETALLDSEDLQFAVEEALALQQLLAQAEEETPLLDAQAAASGPSNWQSMAIAASLLLAVFSTVMYWRVSNQAGEMQQQLDWLRQPVSSVVDVPLDIMRSGNPDSPDLVVRKPPADSMMRLNIELVPQALREDRLEFVMRDEGGQAIVSWTSEPGRNGRVMVLLRPESVPDGRVRLDMSATDGRSLDSRLLEFRASGL